MKISVLGRGKVGGGLADVWEGAGHEVTRIGREGGSVGESGAVLVAVPGSALAQALDGVEGLAGKTVIDATNLIGVEAPQGFASNAEFVKSKTGGQPRRRSTSTSRLSTDASRKRAQSRETCGAETTRRARRSSA